jgi:TonB family protein
VLLLTFLATLCFVQTGGMPTVDPDSAAAHVVRRVAPVYPPIAVAARVEGTVGLAVIVSPAGSVERAVPVRSIPLLDQAAIDAVKDWQFGPFIIAGQAARIETEVDVPFYLDQATTRLALDVSVRSRDCRALLSQKRYDDAESLCAEAANLAGKLSSSDRANAYHLVGQMLIGRAQYRKAIESFSAEIKLRAFSPSEAMTRARQSLAEAYAASGDVKAARREFDAAEKTGRDNLKAEDDAVRAIHADPAIAAARLDQARTLVRSVLVGYGTFLRQTGLNADAAAVEKRLAALSAR